MLVKNGQCCYYKLAADASSSNVKQKSDQWIKPNNDRQVTEIMPFADYQQEKPWNNIAQCNKTL